MEALLRIAGEGPAMRYFNGGCWLAQVVEQAVDLPIISDAPQLMWRHRCIHLLGEPLGIVRFFAASVQFRYSGVQKLAEIGGFWRLSGKVLTECTSILAYTFIEHIFSNDSVLGYIGPISALWWLQFT